MANFGKTSAARLTTLCPELRNLAREAIMVIDFSVIETERGKIQQDHYVNIGASTVEWPNSKHNVCKERPEAEAMDLWPYVRGFGALSGHPDQITEIALESGRTPLEVRNFVYKAFARLAGVIEACAGWHGYTVRWGGDWDGDGDLIDQNFHDLPHFELVRT